MPATPKASLADATLTIDLDAVAANYRLLARRVAPAECAVAIKADAYGLGMARVAPALAGAGAKTFFVAQLAEGVALRGLLPASTIAVFNGPAPGTEADFAAHRLTPVLNHLGDIETWAGLCRSQEASLPAFVHIDTGMNRQGLGPDELAVLADQPQRLAGIDLVGVMSHLACADVAGHPMTPAQLDRFRAARRRLPPARASLANSSGIFRGADYHFDLVRPGCAVYGVNPTPEAANPMRPTVSVVTRVIQVRCVDSPMTVGYGAAHSVTGPGKIATIPVGYADGYLRSLGGRGCVVVSGHTVPVVGRISMDLTTVDVSALPDDLVRPGMQVEVIGPTRTVDDAAAAAGTIGYEILTAMGRRYERVYVGGTADADPGPSA